MNWDKFFNDFAKKRHPSPLREAAKIMGRSDIINLCGGIPSPQVFPFESASFKLSDGTFMNFAPNEMEKATQYSAGSAGIPELLTELTELIKKYHKPPNMADRDVIITTGSQEAISKSFELIISKKDSVLVPKYLYTGVLSVLMPYEPNYIPIEEDENGLIPQSLRDALINSNNNNKGPAPKVLYIIPNGGNPTGTTCTGNRRKEIYKIAQEYDLIILEDDAYFFLNYDKQEPSFLSLDVDGRVIHMDSLSKLISPGLRLGYVCASKEVIYKINAFMQSTVQQASTFSQMIIYKLLKMWKEEGFENQVKKVRTFYKYQRDCMLASAEKWLTGLAEWTIPSGGMFCWFKVVGIKNTTRLARSYLMDHGVSVAPGSYFLAVGTKSEYIRIAFSSCTPQQIDEAFRRLVTAIQEEKLKPVEEKELSLLDCYNFK